MIKNLAGIPKLLHTATKKIFKELESVAVILNIPMGDIGTL